MALTAPDQGVAVEQSGVARVAALSRSRRPLTAWYRPGVQCTETLVDLMRRKWFVEEVVVEELLRQAESGATAHAFAHGHEGIRVELGDREGLRQLVLAACSG